MQKHAFLHMIHVEILVKILKFCKNIERKKRLYLWIFSSSDQYLYAGQNIGRIEGKTKHLEPILVIKKVIEGWFNEHKDANMSYIERFRHAPNNIKIGHFTQLVRDESFAMGCAMCQFNEIGKFTTLYTCDYTLSNIDDYPIYKASNKPASECKTSINEKYPGLCSIKEIFDNELFYLLN